MKPRNILIRLVFTFLMILSVALVKAQGDPGDPFGGDPGGTPSTAVPLDGGLALLLGAGAVYGVKKGYDYRRKKSEK